MKDMLGQEISAGDIFLIPGGNVRYGGLVLEVGVILGKTEKRLKTLITRFDKIKCKPTNKSPQKIMVIKNPSQNLIQAPAVVELENFLEAYLCSIKNN